MHAAEEDFGEEELALLIDRTRFVLQIAFVIYPAFWVLDYALYPAGAWTFLVLRGAATLFSALCYALTFTRFRRVLAVPLSMAHLLGYTFTISIMAVIMGGFTSNYYVGTLLVHFAGGAIVPWRPKHAVIYSLLQVGGYFAILLGAGFPLDHNAISPFAFTSGTALLAVWVSVSSLRLRQKDFELRHQLREMDRHKTEFFANISHEFRTPLTLIIGPLEALLDGKRNIDPKVREHCEVMLRNAQRLLRLINQLLDVSKLEAGKMRLRARRADLGAAVRQIAASFSSLAERKRIQFDVDSVTDGVEAYFDRDKLDKIVVNLLSNAFRFTDSAGKILVELLVSDDAAEIRVCDTGQGIPEADLPRIFDRFHQVDGSSTRKHEGTGLGLALVKELVELHRGSISVTSRLKFGTELTVRLPLGSAHLDASEIVDDAVASERDESALRAEVKQALLAAEAVPSSQPRELAPSQPAEQVDGSGPTVLVVEDNDDMRAFICGVLAGAFSVIDAADGRAGLERAREAAPDLVVSDVMMPGMDGNELLAALRADDATADIPIILLTAKASEETRIAGLERGADDYLTKPFEARELLARAQNLVRMRRQERKLRELTGSLEREIVAQATQIERARQLARFLPPQVVRSVLEEGKPVRVEQERRRVAAFRVELRGFDALESLEAEDVTALLNGYLAAMAEVAFEHGATLDRFVADVVTGFVGAPQSEGAEEDAVRAVRCAIAMVERARTVCRTWDGFFEERLPQPTAIVTAGHTTVGNFGSPSRLEYTAVGGPVSEAATLMPRVRAGEVLCTHLTWSLVRDRLHRPEISGVVVPAEDTTLHRLLDAPAPTTDPTRPRATSSSPPADRTERTAPIDPTNLIDAVVAGRYRVVRSLGEGGMGIVYQARDLELAADVALKVIGHGKRERGKAGSLHREVKLARLITHPNVARIFDLGAWERLEFISMELVDGISLEKRLEQTGPLPLAEAEDVLRQVCAGLEAAHAAKVVHRDLKPSNIMLERAGRVVILDFGVAKWISERDNGVTETLEGFGTPRYMAPEQFVGDAIDERADIYALGVVAFELFTGQRPFEAPGMSALAHKHIYETPRSPLDLRPDMPARVAAVILRCLEKAPSDRFAAIAEVSSLITGTKRPPTGHSTAN